MPSTRLASICSASLAVRMSQRWAVAVLAILKVELPIAPLALACRQLGVRLPVG